MEIEEFGNSHVCIWGAGSLGKKVVSFLITRVNIDCFYDKDQTKHGQFICDIPIKQWSDHQNDEFIVIATEAWREVAKFLKQQGKILFKDYIPWLFLENSLPVSYDLFYSLIESIGEITSQEWKYYKGDKELLIVHGSCHADFLGNLIGLHPEIKKKYRIIKAPLSHYNNPKLTISPFLYHSACHYESNFGLFREVDVFVYQKRADCGVEMDVDCILNKLCDNCKKVRLSFLNFTGYFIQCRNDRKFKNETRMMYSFSYKDYYIDKLIKRGMTDEQIIECVKDENFVPKDRVLNLVNMSIENLKYLDKDSDVKISDYIIDNYKNEQLFYDPGHPSNSVMIEYANRIIRYLLEEDVDRLEEIFSYEAMLVKMPYAAMNGRSTIIYPCVIKALGLEKFEKSFFVNASSFFTESLSFEEYIGEYIKIKKTEVAI